MTRGGKGRSSQNKKRHAKRAMIHINGDFNPIPKPSKRKGKLPARIVEHKHGGRRQ